MSGSANPSGARTKATKEVSGTGTGPLGVQEPKPKQAPSGSHPAGAASSTPQLVYTTAPPVPGLSCRPKPGRGLACLGSGVWSWSARIQTPLITRLVKLGRFSGPRNNSGSNSKASKFWPKDPGGWEAKGAATSSQKVHQGLQARVLSPRSGDTRGPPGEGVGPDRVGLAWRDARVAKMGWAARPRAVTCRRAWSSCGAEDRLSASILVSSLQSSVSSN